MDIFLSDDLPIELWSLIIPHCQVFALIQVSRSSLKRCTPYLDQQLRDGIAFHTYPHGDDRISCNWWGTYTYGSVHFRGTRIHLVPGIGGSLVTLRLRDHEFDEIPPNSPDDVSVDVASYGDDNIVLQIQDIDDIGKTAAPVCTEDLVQWDVAHYFGEYTGDGWMYSDDPFVKSFLAGTYTGVVLADCYDHETIQFIHDYPAFWTEVLRVRELARRANVTFYWV